MSLTIFRPGKRIYTFGDLGTIDIRQRRSAAAVDWWDLLPNVWAAYQPKGAVSFAASLVDLAGNGNDAVDPGGADTPAWDAVNGWKRIANVGYLMTTANPASSAWSALVQFSNHALGNSYRYMFGRVESGKNFLMAATEGVSTHSYFNHGALALGPQLSSGNMAIAGSVGYLNGISEGAIPTPWAGVGAQVLYILRLNGLSLTYWPTQVYMQAVAICDATESPTDILAAATAMAAL